MIEIIVFETSKIIFTGRLILLTCGILRYHKCKNSMQQYVIKMYEQLQEKKEKIIIWIKEKIL